MATPLNFNFDPDPPERITWIDRLVIVVLWCIGVVGLALAAIGIGAMLIALDYVLRGLA
jgi:hypothetical protein